MTSAARVAGATGLQVLLRLCLELPRLGSLAAPRALFAVLPVCTLLLAGGDVRAQTTPNQFGAQDRADAASRMIVIAVQQGISSLPPTSGQSFVYDFDPVLDTYVASQRLGPISFRTPLTVGKGRFSVRVAGSYFSLSRSFGPVPYSITNRTDGSPVGFTQFGLQAKATVGLINVGANYGLTDTVEINVNFPIAIVDASAKQQYPILRSDADLPPGKAPVQGSNTLGLLRDQLAPGGPLVIRSESFGASGKRFNDGTSAGLGRVSLGTRVVLLSREHFRLAGSGEMFLPSPNQDEFAGSDSTAILPRLIGMYELSEEFRLHLDVGYDWDFEVAELSRFTWNVGTSVALTNLTLDFGFGGSEFAKAIRWTPPTAAAFGSPIFTDGLDLKAEGDIELGTTYADFLGGFKVKIADNAVLGGSVSVPITTDGFRPAAIGTVAAEIYF
jgi:Putative MetA-pathway of phenol degradation